MDIVLTGMPHLASKWVRTLAFHPALTLSNSLGKTEIKTILRKPLGTPLVHRLLLHISVPAPACLISLVLPKGRERLFTVASMGEGEN